MTDLFEREQRIYDDAVRYLDEIQNGASCNLDEFKTLTNGYGNLLRHLRRVTRISDKTTDVLNTSRLDLLDKVHYDALTGIYNRRFMEENLKRIIKTMSRSGGKLSIIMMDIDYFKKYNDTYGHSMGDECLRSVAQAIHSSLVRAADFAARYGGEEFVVVLPNTDKDGAYMVAERMLENIRVLNIPHEKNDVADYVTISIGATTGEVRHTQGGVDYIKCADKALYMSKQNGRNQFTFIHLKEGTQ